METSTDFQDSALTITEALFSTPFASEILLCLKGKQECSIEELRKQACKGKDPEEAVELLIGKGLVEADDGSIRLTAKGEKAAEIIDRIEELLEDRGEVCS